jgi:hypothetical protein
LNANSQQISTQTTPSMAWCCNEVVYETSPSVVTAEDGAHQCVTFNGNETQTWVALKEVTYLWLFVGLAQANARRSLPKLPCISIVGGFKAADGQ